MDGFLIILMFAGLTFLVYTAGRKTPLLPKKCKICGERDRNWVSVPTSHDGFGWAHKCWENHDV